MFKVFDLNATREKVYDKLFETLQNEKETRDLEKAIVDYTTSRMKTNYKKQITAWSNKTTRRIYLRKYRSILFNINEIKQLRVEGKSYDCIMKMDYFEINPIVWGDILKEMKRREIASMVAYTDNVCDGLLICYECKSKKTRYTTLQTRSGDEPMTIYARCCSCGFTWTE